MEFLPERFNPSSPLFLTPGGKGRNPNSYCPFVFGARMCPGKALALLEMKIMLIYIISTISWKVNEDDMNNPDLMFTLMSPHELHLTVKSL